MAKEFSGLLCNLYIVALTAVLPLYTQGTYVMLGDTKYALFMNVSLLCLGLYTVMAVVGCLVKFMDSLRTVRVRAWLTRVSRRMQAGIQGLYGRSAQRGETASTELSGGNRAFSVVDVCMLLYGGAVVLSALCSRYGDAAWTGYDEWYMGAMSQLVFIVIYFFVSRQYRGDGWTVYLWEMAFFLVALLGLFSRLGFDPLGLLRGFDSGDWEHSHLISTIGNINWFCGYCAVALAMPVAGFLRARTLRKRLLLYLVSTLGLIVLCVQGSDVGPALAAACLGVCLLWGRKDTVIFQRTMLLGAGTAFGLPCYSRLVHLRGEAALKAQPADGLGLWAFSWNGWWLIGAACIVLYFLLRKLSGQMSPKGEMGRRNSEESAVRGAVIKGMWLGMVILGAAALVVVGALYLSRLFDSEGWVTGRGALWRLAWQGFLRGDWKQKLLGAGPDCFAEYIYSTFAPSELFAAEGHWARAVYANAHNQWLNLLVNMGLFGLCCAVGILVSAVRRYRGSLLGMLALVMYGVNSMVSFQQVLSTPLFFLMLGICEYSVRRSSNCSGRKAMESEGDM